MSTPSLRLAALAVLLAEPALAQVAKPKCAPLDSQGQSTNWGPNYDDYAKESFLVVKGVAGVEQDVQLLDLKRIRKINPNVCMVNGTPLGAVPKGAEGLTTDGVFYTNCIFDLACDEAQLAFFMAHEMRHLKRGPDGKNHFDRVNACTKEVLNQWMASTDMSAYPNVDAALAAFRKDKGGEISTKCVLPVEKEADAFAFELMPKVEQARPQWKVSDGDDPARDARVRAFKNAELWLDAIGEKADDPGHDKASVRAGIMEKMAEAESAKKQRDAEERLRMSLGRASFGR